jgi:23S rRNA (pseudouridine1915-N3)-methyltransferase
MKITVLAIGQRQPRWADEACADYLKRFPPEFGVVLRELKAEPRDRQSRERVLAAEAQRLRAAVPAGARLVALDERGKTVSTREFAALLQRWRDRGEAIAFAIGGPDGLAADVKDGAQLLRLSDLTLPHALARVILLEQLYRGWSILANHPYHRA